VAEDDVRTRRWQRVERQPDPLQALRSAIAAVRTHPRDPEVRRRLRALAAEQGAWEQLALLLTDEARARVEKPEVAAAFYEELADVYENLDQPLETIVAMEAVVALVPGEVDHHDRLARLYDRAGAWNKAAESFERVAALARDDRARAALRAAGRIYREHGKGDRAIDAYRGVVARKPSDLDAWRALDELLAGLLRWREVAEVRGELAARATSGVDKAMALRGQARALEQAGDATGAAELVVRAQQHAPEDVSGLVDYATVLARGGKGREAANVLAARVAEALASGESADEIAALRLRLVAILDDACDDHVAAAAVLDELLADAPEYLPALDRLVQHAARSGNAAVHGRALLRQVAALPDPIDQAAVLVEAGRQLRAGGERRDAARAFERAAELLPGDADLRRELDDEYSAVAVERAVAELAAGHAGSAEKRLRQLLESRPLDLAANRALTDLLERDNRRAAAADHLRETLEWAPEDTPPGKLAPLVHRYALVTAALGDDDAAHQLLHEAHHLDRRALPITLALGESCFRRKLWREAAIHLGGLADHPDAHGHAAAVGNGLVLAARAEVRALRPQNAAKHYEAAVRVDPCCAPAWHALGEAAVARDDTVYAAECFEREAAGTGESKDRARLFEAAGDFALEKLRDAERAERCWAQVVELADGKLLGKLLALQRKRGAAAERGETCELLAAKSDGRARKDLLEEAAQAFAAGDELARATAIADQLVEAYPRDVDAIACASAVAMTARDVAKVARWLGRALALWDAAGDRGDGDPRRADLWRRLGDAERARGDESAALTAYQRAVAIAPESDGALGARRGLVELATSAGRPAGESLAALVAADQEPADVLFHARELARAKRFEDARAMYELAGALGATSGDDDEQFYAAHAPRPLASDEAYAALPEHERRELVDDPADEPLAQLFELLGEAASLVCGEAKSALERAGLADARRMPPTSEAAAAAMYPQIANALGGPTALLYATTRAGTADLSLLLASPPVIALGPRLAVVRARTRADAGDPRPDLELRFRLGRVVELARARRVFAAGHEPAAFARLVDALRVAFDRAAQPAADRGLASDAERLRRLLPVQLRRRVADYYAVFGVAADPDGFRAACERAADRAGLLACGHVGIAIELAGGPAAARHLASMAASAPYLAARRALRARRA
jgi:tetratricopeptide (TPR) repeat protein